MQNKIKTPKSEWDLDNSCNDKDDHDNSKKMLKSQAETIQAFIVPDNSNYKFDVMRYTQ
jgi:hypothetical protein